MQAVEFTSEVTERGELPVPSDIAKTLPHSKKVRVILLFPSDEEEDADWSRLTAEQFINGYAPGDAIYDKE
jgi:hypothetical protein